jgi:hypothetical protein
MMKIRRFAPLWSAALLMIVASAYAKSPDATSGAAIQSLKGVKVAPLYDGSNCQNELPDVLKNSSLSGQVVRSEGTTIVLHDGESVQMIKFKLDGKSYCVDRDAVQLSIDPVPGKAPRQVPKFASVPGASRGLGEDME